MNEQEQNIGKAAGGHARAEVLSKTKRKQIAKNAALARWSGQIKEATHGSPDKPLDISGIEIPCYVLQDETRVLSLRGLQGGIGMSPGGGRNIGGLKLAQFIDNLAASGINCKDLSARLRNPIQFRPPHGGRTAYGYEATILADICDVILAARKQGNVLTTKLQMEYADRCELLVRGFARVGIIALVDEVTGFQKDRKADALARILEAFIAKELQPYVTTFPRDYYEGLFRLRELDYQKDTVKRPSYFGHLTNDLVYKRLAPGVLEELKKLTPRDEETGKHKQHFFRRLTQNTGYPKLREHLGSVITIMKLSDKWTDFMDKMNRLHPQHNETPQLTFEFKAEKDTGKGL